MAERVHTTKHRSTVDLIFDRVRSNISKKLEHVHTQQQYASSLELGIHARWGPQFLKMQTTSSRFLFNDRKLLLAIFWFKVLSGVNDWNR